jgi:hypothetical protein
MNKAVPLATLLAAYRRAQHSAAYQGKTEIVALYDQKIQAAIEAENQIRNGTAS